MAQSDTAAVQQELEWIQLKKDFGTTEIETGSDKFLRKFKQNPFVPIGMQCKFKAP